MKNRLRLRLAIGSSVIAALAGLAYFDRGFDAAAAPKLTQTSLSRQKPPRAQPPLQPVSILKKATSASPEKSSDVLRIDAQAKADLFAAKSWYVAPPPPPPPPPPKPVAPPFPYTYGGAQREGGSITLFLRQGERNVIARPGDLLNGTYRFDEVDNDVAVFTYLPLQEQQRLQIGNLN